MKFSKTKMATFCAAAVVGVSLMASSASAATQFYYPGTVPQFYYNNVPTTNSTEIHGEGWTKFFNAKIHLVEYNNQLMLSKVGFDQYNRQYISESYPVEFNFQGNGWSAGLATPIRMGINNAFRADGGYDSTVRANVNFTMSEFGRTETRPALATMHLIQTENWNHNVQMLSLEIVDANDPSIVLYNSGTNLAMEQRADMATSLLPLVTGKFDAHVFAQSAPGLAYYNNVPAYNYPTTLGGAYYNNVPVYNNAPVYNYPTTLGWSNAVALN